MPSFGAQTFYKLSCHTSNDANSEVVEKFPQLRTTICDKLISTLSEIKSGKVYRGMLWILGEYAETAPEIQQTFQELRKVLGELPILASEQRLLDDAGAEDEEKKDEPKAETSKPRVLADGTYATETAFTSMSAARLEAVKAATKPPLRSKCMMRLDAALYSMVSQLSSSAATSSREAFLRLL